MTDPVLRLTDVVKTYPGVTALKGVSLEVLPGEIHALLGENGAGKSTLIGVAAGSTVPDSGTVEIGGQRLLTHTPAAAQALGLAVVYQHPSVLDDLTVTENMLYPLPKDRRPSFAAGRDWVRQRLAALGADVDPRMRAGELTPAERQLLEIARALARDARVLILDEPTESLTAAESERLFARLAELKAAGTAIVYISHRVPEVRRIADRITVLRDGEGRGTMPAAGVTADDIVRLIVGRSITSVFPAKATVEAGAAPILQVADLAGDRFHDVALTVRPGEIVGLAGVEGNGQREALRAIGGLETARGTVKVGGQAADIRSPRTAQRSGIVLLPGDRHRDGLFLSLPVRENVSVLSLPRVASAGVISGGKERAMAAAEIERLAIKTPSGETPAASLSGGNQQKVLIARSMLAEPRVLLAEEPTKGVDVGARVEIYRILREAAAAGRAVVVQSSDALELHGLCDRVHVFSSGTIVATLEGDQFGEADITGAAISGEAGRARESAEPTRSAGFRRFLSGDYAASVTLAVLLLVIALFTGLTQSAFFSDRNFQSMLLLGSAIAFVALGQLVVLLIAGIDLSVGAIVGITAVLLSFFAGKDQGAGMLALGFLVVVAAAVIIGLANALLIRKVGLNPVIATLATFIVLQGVSLLLRPKPSGTWNPGVVSAIKTHIGPLPLAFVLCLALTIVAELVLRRTRPGVGIRAVGSNEHRAFRLGAPVTRLELGAYITCALFSALGGVMLGSQVAIGDARLGADYTLLSITAVVLGGASIMGGRGSFVGALLGALLLQEIVTASGFLRLGTAWAQWVPGVIVLVAAAISYRTRSIRSGTPT
ncbi:MAG: ATP-binding cassette domain-containing protein [Chloroflexota bacterium]